MQPILFVASVRPQEALEFYRDKLGFALVADEPFAVVMHRSGETLHIQKVASLTPQPFTVLGWEVGDLEATLQRLGLTLERFAWLPQDDRGIWTAEGGARVAWFKDPDGNLLSLTQAPLRGRAAVATAAEPV